VPLQDAGEQYFEHRDGVMRTNGEGLTATYNRSHDPSERTADIQRLRELHVEMDNAVAAAYGWIDLDLGHGFHETKQGLRFTISEDARHEVLARLLKLNHERYEEEVRQGLHDKKKGKGGGSHNLMRVIRLCRGKPSECRSPSAVRRTPECARPRRARLAHSVGHCIAGRGISTGNVAALLAVAGGRRVDAKTVERRVAELEVAAPVVFGHHFAGVGRVAAGDELFTPAPLLLMVEPKYPRESLRFPRILW